jgi:hypothetical protein
MNELINFNGENVSIKTDKGETLINLVNTAKVCGLTKTANSGNTVIRWTSRGVIEKLKIIRGTDVERKYLEEIDYILEEIENTDDRNSIYMSSWLTRRFAMECHSDKAMEYKNFLATLDENRVKKNNNQSQELATMVTQVMTNIIPTLTNEIAKQFVPIVEETKQQVNNMAELIHDQSVIYDSDRNRLKEMIGLRAVNTMHLTDKLKEKLTEHYKENIKGTDYVYKVEKDKLFRVFKVNKWEDIPVEKYNDVYAHIDCLYEM